MLPVYLIYTRQCVVSYNYLPDKSYWDINSCVNCHTIKYRSKFIYSHFMLPAINLTLHCLARISTKLSYDYDTCAQ